MTFSHTGKSLSIVFLSEELLKNTDDWNTEAENFIKSSGTEIKLLGIVSEYTNKVNSFYMWLYKELLEYHAEDFRQKDMLAKRLGINIKELESNFKNSIS